MSSQIPVLVSRLTPDRPAVLFLGQRFMTFVEGADRFLVRATEALDVQPQISSYRELCEELGEREKEDIQAYLMRLASAVSPPQAMGDIANFPWNAVYTTLPLTAISNAFEMPWRQVQPVRNPEYVARGQRDSRKLHVVQLFGDYGVSDSRELAPFSEEDYEHRDERAVPRLLDHLEALVTPFGSLIIEGYDPASDWLEFKRLRTRISGPQFGQVHWFSFPDHMRGDKQIRRLVSESRLFCYSESLLEHMGEFWAKAVGDAHQSYSLYTTRHTMVVHGKTVPIPEHLWRQLQATATIMHKGIGYDRYEDFNGRDLGAFRRYLKESTNSPVWSAHRVGIPFARSYEDQLHARVLVALEQGSHERPVILHGSSATGKSVALAALAYRVSQVDEFPVIYYGYGAHPTDTEVIVRYWKDFLAATGARSLLIVWDGMKEIKTYADILRRLSKLGLPVVLVGSHYRLKEDVKKPLPKEIKKSLVEASNALHGSEEGHFLDYLHRFGLDVTPRHGSLKPNERFWVLLYRLSVPELRDQLLKALYGEEMRVVEVIQKHLEVRAREHHVSDLARQLAQLFPDVAKVTDTKERPSRYYDLSQGQVLIALVMVAAQFGHGVPLELLIRADRDLGGLEGSYEDFETVLQVQDLIQISTDRKSNLTVDARHPVEARALIQSLTPTPSREVELLVALIKALEKGTWTFEDEVEFLSELLRDVGPRGYIASKEKYGKHFLEISDALRFLRDTKNIIHPSLVLKESFFIRQWILANPNRQQRNELLQQRGTTVRALLAQAEDALSQVLDSADIRSSDGQRMNLLTERGAVAGFRAVQTQAAGGDLEEVRRLFWVAWPYLSKASDLNPLNYHPVDVMEWVGREMLPVLDRDEDRATVIKQVWEALDRINPEDLPQDQMALYYRARDKFSDATGQNRVDPAVYDSMINNGNPVGLFCKAWSMMGRQPSALGTDKDSIIHPEQREMERGVFDLLWAHRDLASNDLGCLNLMRRAWWESSTGSRLMRGSKERVKLSESEWHDFLGVLRLYNHLDPEHEHLRHYLEGLAHWHLHNPVEGDRCFENARRASRRYVEGLGGIKRYHTLCNEHGEPIEFTGIVRRIDGDRGDVEVPGLGVLVPFKLGRGNFRLSDLREGDALGRFFITFNYEGAIADPPVYVDQGLS